MSTLALFLVSTGVTHVPIFFFAKDVPILFSCIVHLRRTYIHGGVNYVCCLFSSDLCNRLY